MEQYPDFEGSNFSGANNPGTYPPTISNGATDIDFSSTITKLMIELVAAVHYQGSALDLLDKKIVKIHASIEQLPTLIVSMNTEAGRSSSNIDDINTNVDRSNALRDINNSLQNMVGHFDKQWRTLFDGLQKSHAQLSRQVVESGGTAESLADREECLAMLRSLVQYSKRVKSAIEAYSGADSPE